jgi:hypothetical protein
MTVSDVLHTLSKRFTYTNDLVLGTSRKVLTAGAEANTPDVQVAIFWQAAVLEMSHGVSSLDIEDLCGAVATCRHEATVETEAHTADDTLMGQVVDQVDIEDTAGARVEDGEPIAALLLQVLRELLNVQIGQNITLRQRDLRLRHQSILLVVWGRCRAGDLGRSGIRRRVVLLGSGRSSGRSTRRTWTLSARRRGGLWRLGKSWSALEDMSAMCPSTGLRL